MGNPSGLNNVNEESFRALAKLVYAESGLMLVPEKILMVQSRLRPRMKALGLSNIEQYQALVCSETGREERREMISALTTNVSHFFREPHHFDALEDHLVKKFSQSGLSGSRLRIWSAGCSNGQEATSIAISILKKFPGIEKCDFRILATDIDPTVVEFARSGEYPEKMTSGLSVDDKRAYFHTSGDANEPSFVVKKMVRDLISYKELNLLAKWPMKQKFDAIFCRNVVIYFDAQTQANLWPRFHEYLLPDGLFFLGHSERMTDPESVGYASIGPTAYKRKHSELTRDRKMELEVKHGTT